MADVRISYKGGAIAELDGPGTKTLKTGGRYCEGDVVVTYTPRVDNTFRRWDVTIAGTIVSNSVLILQDDWLADHREDAGLCVLVIPKFPIVHSSERMGMGVWLGANSPFLVDSAGVGSTHVALYMHTNGSPAVRFRSMGLTGIDNIGDMYITKAGELKVVATAAYPVTAGEYCVIAWLK